MKCECNQKKIIITILFSTHVYGSPEPRGGKKKLMVREKKKKIISLFQQNNLSFQHHNLLFLDIKSLF